MKPLKVPVAFLRRHYLGKSVEEALSYRVTLILIMQGLDLVINREKSILIPTQIIKLFGMKIDLKTMTI